MSDAVLSQLLEAESQLSSQETALAAQLNAIQAKRKGVQTVIEMFQSPASDNGAAAVSEAVDRSSSQSDQPAVAQTTKMPIPRASKPAKGIARRMTKATPVTSTVSEDTASSRRDKSGKSPNWQRYVQEPFRKTPLPDVVANILKAQPDDAFKIAEVMEVIFKPDMPQSIFLKARNRVSNILSAGARSGEWSRGRGGRYSISRKSLK